MAAALVAATHRRVRAGCRYTTVPSSHPRIMPLPLPFHRAAAHKCGASTEASFVPPGVDLDVLHLPHSTDIACNPAMSVSVS